MLFEHATDLVGCRKTPFVRRFEAAINPRKLCRRCLIFSAPEARIDFKRDPRKLGLRFLGPFFHAFQNVFKKFGCHEKYSTSAGITAKKMSSGRFRRAPLTRSRFATARGAEAAFNL